jgi:ribosomal protein L40E
MKCHQCGIENPNQSKFCRKCGTALGIGHRCTQCGFENPEDSLFCTECGERLSGSKKSAKGTQRKCRSCGHFNELDALFCVSCGEEMTRVPKEKLRGKSTAPSYKTIALVIGVVFLLGFAIKLGINFSKEKNPSPTPASSPPAASLIKVDETKVIAVAKNFKCACGGCGELPLETCNCDMPKGAVEEKNFIREKLGEGLTVERVIELLDKKYGHRV